MKFKLPSLPLDDDAKGIVVRVLSYEYYLKPFWLTFKDPYIEVEYQISTRRMRLKQSIYYSLLIMILGIYSGLYPFINYTSDNPAKKKYSIMSYITGSILVSTSFIHIICCYIKCINNVFNWPILSVIKNTFIFFIFYYIILEDIFHITYQNNLSVLGNDFRQFVYIYDTEISHTIFIFLITLFLLTILSISMLNIKQYIILIIINSLGGVTLLLRYNYLAVRDYEDLYNRIGWNLGSVLIPDLLNYGFTNTNEEICKQIIKIISLKKEIKSIYPYNTSIFNINKYFTSVMNTYIFVWLILVFFLYCVVYNNEKKLRADFILRRVYSDKDKSRNFESGIEIKTLIDNIETEKDRQILSDNINKWKQESTQDSNSTIKDLNNIDIKEIKIDDFGYYLEEKTTKSVESDTSSNDIINNQITQSVEKIIPTSYTKSNISEMGSVLGSKTVKSFISDDNNINDTKSESNVQC